MKIKFKKCNNNTLWFYKLIIGNKKQRTRINDDKI